MHAMYDLGIIIMHTSWHEAYWYQSITIEDCDWTCLHRVFHFAGHFSGHKKLIHALQQSMAEQKQQARARVIHGRAFFGIQKFLGSLSAQPSVWGQFLTFDVDCTTSLGTVCSYRTKYLLHLVAIRANKDQQGINQSTLAARHVNILYYKSYSASYPSCVLQTQFTRVLNYKSHYKTTWLTIAKCSLS